MRIKLKPCPFCGGNNLSVEGITFYWVECIDCNASISGNETKEEAIEAWNRRSGNDYTAGFVDGYRQGKKDAERKKGRWIIRYAPHNSWCANRMSCSVCGHEEVESGDYNYCPNCGARMEAKDE